METLLNQPKMTYIGLIIYLAAALTTVVLLLEIRGTLFQKLLKSVKSVSVIIVKLRMSRVRRESSTGVATLTKSQ